jgi:chromosome segregation ATPase
VNKEDLAISSILERTGNNDETDILEYCTPNYATNTSKLFSTKEKDVVPSNSYESEKMNSSDSKIAIDINNLESFSLGPNGENLTSKRQSQQLVEELRSLQEQNRSYRSSHSDFVKEYWSSTPQPNASDKDDLSLLQFEKDTSPKNVKESKTNISAKYLQNLHSCFEEEKESLEVKISSQKEEIYFLKSEISSLKVQLSNVLHFIPLDNEKDKWIELPVLK